MKSIEELFWFEKALFYMIRYPAYTDDYIKQEIESQANYMPKAELVRYMAFNANRRHFMLEIIVIYTIFCLKNFYFVYYTMTYVEFNHPQENIKPSMDNAAESFNYTCLVSDCCDCIKTGDGTKISLASELIKLPVFAICRQDIKWHYSPTLGFQKIALILNSFIAFLNLALCIILPIFLYSTTPPSNTAVMFSICPLAELARVRRKMGEILDTLSYSLNNFIANLALERQGRESDHSRNSYQATKYFGLISRGLFVNDHNEQLIEEDIQMAPNNCRVPHERTLAGHQDNKQQNDLSPFCLDFFLPINRTQWWRHKWANSLVAVWPLVFINAYLAYVIGHLSVAYYAQHISLQENSDFLDSLAQENCSLWFNSDHGSSNVNDTTIGGHNLHETRQVLDLKHIEMYWNWFTIGELLLLPMVPIFVIGSTLCNYYFVCTDIRVCIMELRILLDIAIDCIELNYAKWSMNRANNRGDHNRAKTRNQQVFELRLHQSLSTRRITPRQNYELPKPKSTPRIRPKSIMDTEASLLASMIFDRTTKTINFDWLILFVTPVDGRSGKSVDSKLEARLVNQEFAIDMMGSILEESSKKRADWTVDLFVMLLAKIHVCHQTLARLLDENNTGIRNVLIIGYIVNYGFALIGVYFYRNINDYGLSPLLMIIIQWLVLNFFILIVSSIHANLKKLDNTFWFIVASTTNCQDVRVQHFRCIWCKKLTLINAEGGLSLKVYKISVTYVRILQLVFGTATIFALALTRY